MSSIKLKYIIIFILLFSLKKHSFGQTENHKYDSILVKALERNIGHPYYHNGSITGANIIKITKKDSILSFTSIFKTNPNFEILNYESVINDVNIKCNKFINKTFELIIPIYFFFIDMDDIPLDPKERLKVDKKLNKFRRQKKNVSSLYVTVIESLPIRCRKKKLVS